MRILTFILLFFCLLSFGKENPGKPKVVDRFPAATKTVALTFDACEAGRKPVYFDTAIVNFLTRNKIPASIFLTGSFAYNNEAAIRSLRKYPFIEFENHSMHHYMHMEKLKDNKVITEVLENQKVVKQLTSRNPKYFRFPAGNYNERDLAIVDSLGLKVVHWTYASGDPDKRITTDKLISYVMEKTVPGDILIFHINGRGYSTAAALPVIYKELTEKGYKFVRLDEVVK